jgi:aldehyde dehydrogenase (NAD+)
MSGREVEVHNRVGARWLPSLTGRWFEDCDPATEEVIGRFPLSSADDVDAAVDAARDAFSSWRRVPAPRRAEFLFRAGELMVARKEELAREVTREMGKVLDEARGDVQESIDLAYYFAGEGRRLLGVTTPSESRQKMAYSLRVPLGVVGAICPFNFPLAIPALKVLPAIVAGNTVVLKPAGDTPRMAILFAEILEQAGLPPGVVNIVSGGGEEVGQRIVEHPNVALISFTGSKAVGIDITQRAAPTLKKTILELGGKNCIIVLDDADLDLAVRATLWAAFGTSGQRCTSASRIIVQDKIHGPFVDRFARATESLSLGSGLDEATDVGPLINRAAVERVQRYVELGRQEGAELLVGGDAPSRPGHYFSPTLFTRAEPGMRLVTDEIFGPVTAVMRARDLEDALRIANDTEYGLSAAIFTENVSSALRAVDDIETGLFYVNAGTTGAEAHLPTGGMKASGNGHREAGVAGIDSYTEWRSVYIDYSHRIQRAQIDIEP